MIYFAILFIILLFLTFLSPYIDYYKDNDGTKHLIIWYTNVLTDERNFYQIY